MAATSPCKLRGERPAIPGSHVLPAFVAREIKKDSPTGFFRNPNKPNVRIQDCDTVELLCEICEQRFSAAERQFATSIFQPFHRSDQTTFEYGGWLHYFMTSLAWRTLVLDLPGFHADPSISVSITDALEDALSTMSAYLLGATALGGSIRNHAVLLHSASACDPQLSAIGPNVKVRRSILGYSVVEKNLNHAAVIHNLAGFVSITMVKGNPQDVWDNTRIDPVGGWIRGPQRVNSWLIADLFNTLIVASKNYATMSDAQKAQIHAGVRANPGARGLRFRPLDDKLPTQDPR